MTRSLACLLTAALALPAWSLAQSPYHTRVLPPLSGLATQDKDKEKDKEKDKDKPREKDEEKPEEKEKDKDREPEAPATIPILYPTNPYPAPAPAIMDPRFRAWQQVFPGPNSPYNNVPASTVIMHPHVAAPAQLPSAVEQYPIVAPARPMPSAPLLAVTPAPAAAPTPVATPAPVLAPAPVVAPAPAATPVPSAPVKILPELPTRPETQPEAAPVAAPPLTPVSAATTKPVVISLKKGAPIKQRTIDLPNKERTIDLIRDSGKGTWRVSEGPR